MTTQAPINIVEPTLESAAGHCYSFVSSVCRVVDRPPLRVWVARDAELEFPGEQIEICRCFWRKIRRIQAYFLYRKLLCRPGKIFVSTAGRIDLALLDLASREIVPPGKAYFFFHWFNVSPRRLRQLKRIAQKQPNLIILGPTPTVVEIFREAGFKYCRLVPYPLLATPHSMANVSREFTHLLYAGAARQDKGFSHVVDLVELLAKRQPNIPVELQTSARHYDKYDAATKMAMSRLESIHYSRLTVHRETLTERDYQKLFEGAICLQLYNPADFADRISGVTLDALSSGCPIVATAGTWSARMVQRFQAGAVMEGTDPQKLLQTIQGIIANYRHFSDNAFSGGQVLRTENSAENLIYAIEVPID